MGRARQHPGPGSTRGRTRLPSTGTDPGGTDRDDHRPKDMATSEQLTVTEALRAAVRSLVLFVRLTLDRPVRRRRVTEARVLLGAAAAAYLRERSAPGFLARALANRRAAEVRLSRLEARPGPDGERPAAV